MKFYVNKPTKSKGVLATMFFNADEIREIIHDAGDAGYLMMTYYVGIAQQRNPNMEDTQLAKLTGKSVKTVADIRRRLTKTGWFDRKAVTLNGERYFMYLVGKDNVIQGFQNTASVSKVKGKN